MHDIIYWLVTVGAGIGAAALAIYNGCNWIGQERFLCDDCRFNSDRSCVKPERPTAIRCISYRPDSV